MTDSMSREELVEKFSNIDNLSGLLEAVTYDLVEFVKYQTKKPEDTSVLSCTKKISRENGQDLWAFFCSIINFSVQVRKFMMRCLEEYTGINSINSN